MTPNTAMASLDIENSTFPANTVTAGVVSVFEGNEKHITIISVLYIIISIIGMLGNIFVFVAVALSRKLHTFTNVFVVNLSVFDFLTCFGLPFQAIGITATDGWPLPPAICTIIAAMAIVTQSGSVITLALIGVNRYVLIVRPKEVYCRIYTRCKVGVMIAGTWLFPILFLVVPQLIPGIGCLGYSKKFKVCLWDTKRNSAIVMQAMGAIAFIVSTVFIIFSYSAIYHFIRKHIKESYATLQMNTPSVHRPGNGHHPGNITQRGTAGINKRQIQITKNLGWVMAVFFACVLPYTCILLVPTKRVAGIYIAMLFLLPSAINPILYAAKHPHFRVVFRCMVHCRYSAIPLPSAALKKLLKQSPTRRRVSLSNDAVDGP